MFRNMRRIKQELPALECEDILRRGVTGILAVTGDEGYPYIVPQNYVYLQGRIYLHGAASGHRADAVRRNDKVCFCVIDRDDVVPETYSTDYASVTVFGRASFVEDAERKYFVLDKLCEKYRPGYEEERRREIESSLDRTCITEITPEHITGKESLALHQRREAKSRL